MTLDLPPAPSLGEAFQQALAREIVEIAAALADGPTETGVHRARKACKRGRAVSALLQGSLGRRRAKDLDRGFRDVARPLGPVRDADVLRKRLVALDRDPGRVPPVHREGPCLSAITHLALVREDVEALTLELRPGDVQDALVESWHAARRARRDVDPSDDETVHEWRKRVKALWIQADLCTRLAPDALVPLTGPLDVLQESLGDHHDLAVLALLVPEDAALIADARLRADVLLQRALAQGRVVLAARPRHLRLWIEAAWAP